MDILKVDQKEHSTNAFMAKKVTNSEKRIFGANSQMTVVEQRPKTLKELFEEKERARLVEN